jgi:hypothetical protein
VQQREEGDLDRRVGTRNAGARRRIAAVLDLADPHAGVDVGRRGPVDDHLRAAMIEIVLGREDRNPRRLEADLDVAGDRRVDVAKAQK